MYADVLPCFPADSEIPSSYHEDDPCATRHAVKTHIPTDGTHRNSVPNDVYDDYVQNDNLYVQQQPGTTVFQTLEPVDTNSHADYNVVGRVHHA